MRGAILTLLAFACGLLTAGAKADTDSSARDFGLTYLAGEKAGAQCMLDETKRVVVDGKPIGSEFEDCIHSRLQDKIKARFGAAVADRLFFEPIPPAIVNGEIRTK